MRSADPLVSLPERTPLFETLRRGLDDSPLHGATAAALGEALVAAALVDSTSVTELAGALASHRGKSPRHLAKQLDRLLGNPRFDAQRLLTLLQAAVRPDALELVTGFDALDGAPTTLLLARTGQVVRPLGFAPASEGEAALVSRSPPVSSRLTARLRGGAVALAEVLLARGQPFVLLTDTRHRFRLGPEARTRSQGVAAAERLARHGVALALTEVEFERPAVVVPQLVLLDRRFETRVDPRAQEEERVALGRLAPREPLPPPDPRLRELLDWWPRYWLARAGAASPSRRPRSSAGRRPLWPEGRLVVGLASADARVRDVERLVREPPTIIGGPWLPAPPPDVRTLGAHARARRDRLLALWLVGLHLRHAAEETPAVLPG